MVTVKLGGKDIIIPGEGYDAFEDYLYHTPSQPELFVAKRSDIVSAYQATIKDDNPTASRVGDADDWNAQYKALKSYHAKHGDCFVPFGRETGPLRSWTERQKQLHASSKLELDKVEKMKALGFDFKVKSLSTRSVDNIRKPLSNHSINQTKSKSNTSNVSTSKKTKSMVRRLEGKQPSKRQKAGVKPKTRPTSAEAKATVECTKPVLVIEDDATWNKNYIMLKTFRSNNGNCLVPFGKETGALRSWTERQKKLFASSKLDKERLAKMTYIGFEF